MNLRPSGYRPLALPAELSGQLKVVQLARIELATPPLSGVCSAAELQLRENWRVVLDSNQRLGGILHCRLTACCTRPLCELPKSISDRRHPILIARAMQRKIHRITAPGAAGYLQSKWWVPWGSNPDRGFPHGLKVRCITVLPRTQ